MQSTLERAVQHWEMVAPVINSPETSEDYDALISNIEEAMSLHCEGRSNILGGLIEVMSKAASRYEVEALPQLKGCGLDALRYLIKLHRVTQSDLPEIGSQGVVSEVLNGKRSLTVRHVRGLAKRFSVSPSTFIDD